MANPDEFDLVISDLTMPRMTGIQLAKKLKLIAPKIPVLLCSGLKLTLESEGISETNIKQVLMKMEMFDVLPKLLRSILDEER